MIPRIAISADTFTEATSVINERDASFAPRPIIEALVKSHALPVIIPSIPPELVSNYVDLFDGIIFAGGEDIDPTFYGEEPHPGLGMTYRKRDLAEIQLLKEAVKAGKAIMGICRGMQLINIGLGGTVYQDIAENPVAKIKHSQLAPGNLPTHHVNTVANSRIRDLAGDRAYVNSRHHQTLHNVAPGLKVTATADDQVIEAVESVNSNQILAVQWHPENMYKHDEVAQNLFHDLVQRAGQVAQKNN
ncbi:MAG: gamma-glutamyl-gamma-aminobutyrate hydrolase family protein [Limosilactobacillus coleohominis]|uniref:gamma-glutamyl-gamma-aminobutyrate hydrolase family protein n=1 Tax=Limosilactobacillus coleohominis TaxID=181675 RepID=UPI002A819B4F|nr:gamma-glutamyl-gamma-aminobutyrate hydrolase family protein [Limosilactobacillus coleohominis]MCI5812575.1 gamma-glutamyl-gamma-aminobutyrate hydrolase family protein [Lactobacillus sp.]MDY3702466.1 gamma-glutamyl-gamma-aminobutyrate hydrolase family protein [Limosilactobacillus coleohominis]MDY5628493.1 gamma-glutamyl-gamma-aminobutyrate hydrolase family protein [Limosilactobacillus coleohominis]